MKAVSYTHLDVYKRQIENEVIDGASEDINADYEEMVLLKEKYASKRRK